MGKSATQFPCSSKRAMGFSEKGLNIHESLIMQSSVAQGWPRWLERGVRPEGIAGPWVRAQALPELGKLLAKTPAKAGGKAA